MPRVAIQDNNWNFVVQPVQLNMPNGRPSGVWANVRTDTDAVIGVVSEDRYGLIQNQDFIGTIRGALDNLGLTGYQESIICTRGGERLYATYSFDKRIKTIHKVGDEVGLVLRFANSFDCGIAALGELLAKILRCTNGMVLEQGQFRLQKRHTTKINLDFLKQVIAAAVNDFDRALQVFEHLAGVRISDEQGINILKHIAMSKAMRQKIQNIWINPNFVESRKRNLYTLYDAATEHFRDLEATRFEQSARMNRIVLSGIVQGLVPDKLAELVKPVVEPDDDTQVIEVEGQVVK